MRFYAAWVRSLSNSVWSRQHAALIDSFMEARKAGAEILVLIDGDGQHNPDEIPLLLAPILRGEADMVNGSKFLKGNVNNVPRYRRLGQEVLTLATNTGTKQHITDTQCGFRAFSRKAIASLSFSETGFGVESEMQFRAKQCGLKVAEVSIRTNYDEEVKRSPVAHGFGVLFRMKMWWEK